MKERLKKNIILFWEFFKVGMFIIGGGAVMIPLIEDMAVRKKGWLTNEEIIDCIAISQSLPGAIAVSAATFIGKKEGRLPGAIFATTGVILPSFIVISLVVIFFGQYIDNPHVQGAFIGIKAAMCGLVGMTAYRLGKRVCKTPFHFILAIGGFIAVGVCNVSAMWVVVAAGLLGFLWAIVEKKFKKGEEGNKQ